jgi:hypothetical protein
MKTISLKKSLLTALISVVAGYAGFASAHTAGGVIDAAGTNASATDFATVSCFNDGSGAPAYLAIQIQDESAPVPGLLMTMMAAKGNQVITTSDPVSGDSNFGPSVQLKGGDGTYYITASKTAAGSRRFTVSYHCMTSSNDHTGTDITALQIQ